MLLCNFVHLIAAGLFPVGTLKKLQINQPPRIRGGFLLPFPLPSQNRKILRIGAVSQYENKQAQMSRAVMVTTARLVAL